MAYEQTLKTIGAPAGADLSASQFCFVVVNSNGQLALPAAGGDADGILQDKPSAAGWQGEVAVLGVSKVVVGTGGVTAGDLLATDNAGKAVNEVEARGAAEVDRHDVRLREVRRAPHSSHPGRD